MKFAPALVTALAIAACAYSTASMAESGTPSRQEAASAASGEVVSNDDGRVNDYARYLMVVDGKRRTDAVVEARNYPSSDCIKVAQHRDIGSCSPVDGARLCADACGSAQRTLAGAGTVLCSESD